MTCIPKIIFCKVNSLVICAINTLLAVNNFCLNDTGTVCYSPNQHQLTETTGYLLYVLYQIIGSIILMRMLTSLMTETLKALRVRISKWIIILRTICQNKSSMRYSILTSPCFVIYLPTAYVVRGTVMFSICSHLGGGLRPGTDGGGFIPARSNGGYPCQVWQGGTPPHVPPVRPSQGYPDWGVPHLGYPPIRPVWGVPWQGVPNGGYPTLGTPLVRPGRGGGVPHLIQDNRWITWYAAVGMPLAFTQEDVLVRNITSESNICQVSCQDVHRFYAAFGNSN